MMRVSGLEVAHIPESKAHPTPGAPVSSSHSHTQVLKMGTAMTIGCSQRNMRGIPNLAQRWAEKLRVFWLGDPGGVLLKKISGLPDGPTTQQGKPLRRQFSESHISYEVVLALKLTVPSPRASPH